MSDSPGEKEVCGVYIGITLLGLIPLVVLPAYLLWEALASMPAPRAGRF